ncbi:MAG TPA: diguanylate cyclase [Methylotenera sp.]|nr:diguanylate cyclase [Methylotenera sp.]
MLNELTIFRRYSYLALSLLLIFVYVVTGKLGLMLALPPGYASAIFPPAGIAIAAFFVAGKKSLPAIFLGSLFLNIWVGYSSNHTINITGLEVALLIAFASMMQAWLGGWWLRRRIGYPTALDSPRDVVNFFISSPFICFVSASISVSGLFAFGLIEEYHFFSSWASWWIGDFLGLIVMLPLTLVAIGSPRKIWRKRLGTVALPMVIAFALLIVTFVTVSRLEHKDSLIEFNGLSNQLSEQLQVRFDSQESVLMQTSGLFTYRNFNSITRQDFHNFVKETLKGFPMIYAIEWAPRIGYSNRAAFNAEQARDFPDFDIKETGLNKALVPASVRNYYYPLTYIEPMTTEVQSILGFDLASLPDRKATILKALKENTAVATPPVKLIIQQGTETGLLLIYPVNGNVQDGVVLTVLKASDFLGEIFMPMQPSLNSRLVDVETGLSLYDGFTDNQSEVLYMRQFVFGTRHYRLETTPTALYYERQRSWQSWNMLAVGIFGTGLMGALLLLGTGYTARVEALVEEKTAALKESSSRFQEITSTLGEGVYVMDKEGLITFINPEAQRLLGWTEAELVGQHAHLLIHYKKIDHSPYHADDCEMRNVMKSGQPFKSTEEVFWRKDGTPMNISVTSVPMFRNNEIVGAVVVFEDITDRKKTEHALRASEKSFREIIEYAPIGMTIVSLEGKFIKVNQSLSNIVGYDSEELLKLTFQEITHPDDLSIDLEYLHQLLDDKINSYQMEKRYIRKDKKIVWVQLSVSIFRDEDKTPLYFISQIEDITERKLQHEQSEQYAYFDPLTNLPNRRMLLNRLNHSLAQAQHHEHPMARLFLDLDYFKNINDSLGHDAGDVILKEVATRLSACVRIDDAVSRLGGDEFVIILTEIAQVPDAQLVAEKVLDSFKQPIKVNGQEITISTSIGIAVRSNEMETTVDELMKHADMAMYEAKGAGRNRYHFYSD